MREKTLREKVREIEREIRILDWNERKIQERLRENLETEKKKVKSKKNKLREV